MVCNQKVRRFKSDQLHQENKMDIYTYISIESDRVASEIREWCGLEDWEEEQISDMLAHFAMTVVDKVKAKDANRSERI